MDRPKYSLPEIERRWLVPAAFLDGLAGQPHRVIEDVYIERTRLRLRAIHEPDGRVAYKLCKKYGRSDSLAQPITNIYLSGDEYLALLALGGSRVRKQRYAVADGAIDVYLSPVPLGIFEIEFPSEQAAAAYVPPRFVGREVTDDMDYSGASLARSA